jgi:glycosyltransferase involved in cell wall biosynthesis
MRALVAIPCFNERANILRTLEDLRGHVPQVDCLVVDDGSADDTATALREAAPPHVTVLRHPVNLGYGCAIQTAAKYALAGGYDIVVFFDGDGQHSGSDVPLALAVIAEGRGDVAIASRFLGTCGYPIPFSRRAGMTVYRGLLRALSGLRITDPTSGFQALDRRAMLICASESFSTAYPDADMLLLYHRAGLKVAEFPGCFKPRISGRSMHNSFVSALHYIYNMSISMLVVALTPHRPDKVG